MRQRELLALEPQATEPAWLDGHKGSRALLRLADRHYSRQQPGTPQCCRPGHNLVLLTACGRAAWVVWRPIPQVGRKDGLEAWECTLFRNETAHLSSVLISLAADATWRRWGWPPRDGLITAVDPEATRRRRSQRHEPGHCFRVAGWTETERRGEQVWLRAPHPQREARHAA